MALLADGAAEVNYAGSPSGGLLALDNGLRRR